MKRKASKLDSYAEQLRAWFTPADQGGEGLTLSDVRARLADSGFAVSLSRLSTWWSAEQDRQMRDQILGRITSGARLSADLEKRFAKDPPPEIETLLKIFRVLIMQMSLQGQANPDILKLVGPLMTHVMGKLKLDDHAADRDLELRRVTLLEAKAAKADQAEQVEHSALSEAEKAERIRAIFKP